MTTDRVYPPVIGSALAMFRVMGLRFDLSGAEHIPATGGAVLASNHVSYLDFIFVGYAARPAGRYVRFMAKDAVFRHRIAGPLMRGMHHIPVDRTAGAASYKAAVEALHAGEILGVFPEATISESFAPKEFKTGAVRMAAEAGVPLIPMATFGGQRILTKGRRRDLTRGRRIVISVGEPLVVGPGDNALEATAQLRASIQGLVAQSVDRYPRSDEPDQWWLPATTS
ncbi:MAG: lysophospholipid acyltransferase family protein [Actinomycetes bacterium]